MPKLISPNLELTDVREGTFESWGLAKVFKSVGTWGFPGIMGVLVFGLPVCSFLACLG